MSCFIFLVGHNILWTELMAGLCILTSHKSSINRPLYHILLKTMMQPKFLRMMRKFGNSNYFTYIASCFHNSKHKHYNIIKTIF